MLNDHQIGKPIQVESTFVSINQNVLHPSKCMYNCAVLWLCLGHAKRPNSKNTLQISVNSILMYKEAMNMILKFDLPNQGTEYSKKKMLMESISFWMGHMECARQPNVLVKSAVSNRFPSTDRSVLCLNRNAPNPAHLDGELLQCRLAPIRAGFASEETCGALRALEYLA